LQAAGVHPYVLRLLALPSILQALGGELVNMTAQGTQGKVSSTFWRFLALTDPTATRVICRDADSRLSARDKAAVSEWMASAYPFHVMHDHPHHNKWPVLAGLFGSVNGLLHPKLILKWFKQDQDVAKDGLKGQPDYKWTADQNWLRDTVWPLVRNHTLSHSSFNCGDFGEAKSQGFPVKRASASDFVGNIHELKNVWQGQALPVIAAIACPLKCRRQPDWVA
jgi:hypothetical protein